MSARAGDPRETKLPRFHPSTVIRELGDGEVYTISDATCHLGVWGATGGGKTFGSGIFFALGLLGSGAEAGFLVLCSKPSELSQWLEWAEMSGRSKDVRIIDVSGTERFNFLEWESSQAATGGLTINVVALLEEIITALEPQKAQGGGDTVFWTDSLHQLLVAVVELVQLAGYELRMATLRDIVRSAPLSREQSKDADWRKESVCWFFLEEARKRCVESDEEIQADYAECRAYFLDDFANLSEKTRSIITLMFTKLAASFTARPLRKLLCTDTTIRPEDTFDGKILIVALDTQTYRLAGRIAALTWKFCWQVSVMRRAPAPKGEYLRPIVCWADEAADNFLSNSDLLFASVARQSAGCLVYLSQNISQYRKRLGDNDAFEALAANFQTKVFHQNTGPTNRWAAEILGERWMQMRGVNANVSTPECVDTGRTSSSGVTLNLQHRFLLEPSVFTTLKRGGPAYGFQVEAVLYKGGHLFADGMPFKRMLFKQR
jgi:hypothetical protein